ncbi:MAG: hypothetical protein LBT75_00105, partial [Bacilli bacterium]|nr:hypothetical protein [Bacilli bacterium]
NMIIFSNNEKEINKISDMSLKLDLFNMKFDKLQDTTNEYLDFVKEGLLINGTIFILSVLFVVFTTTVCINRIIKSSINKYIIYYYCGASLKNIIINININLLLLELISLLVPIIYCLSFNINLFIVFVLLVISLLINLFSSMIIYFNLRKNNLISLYRLEK